MEKKQKSSRSLLKILRFVMIMLVPMAVITLLLAVFTIRRDDAKKTEQLQSTMDYHVEQLDNMYTQLNYFLMDSLSNDQNAVHLENLHGEQTLAPYWTAAVVDSLQPLQSLFNTGLSFFITVPEYNLYSCRRSSLDSYSENLSMQQYVQENLDQIPPAGYLNKTIDLDGTIYLLTACQKRGVYLSSWIKLDNLFSFMDSVISDEDGYYLLVDQDFSPLTDSERFVLDGFALREDGSLQTSRTDASCDLHWTAFGIGIITLRKDAILSETIVYLFCILLLFCIAFGFGGYIIFYFRHYIQEPLQFFQNHVNDYLKDRRFSKRYGFAELDEVENAFSALEKQVEELKIDIYEEKLKRTRTELEFLQNQFKPHFFVNCFNIIIGMAECERFDQIQNFCMLLSSYVRYTLRDGFETVPLAQELEQSRDFLDIQNIRFDTRATLSQSEDSLLETAAVPPMIVLSFIENSIKYNKFKIEHLQLQVDVRRLPGGLHGLLEITYSDNGVGMDEEGCAKSREMLRLTRESVLGDGENVVFGDTQIGIQNVYRRMLLLYGERADMELVSGPGGGFVMRMTLPYVAIDTPAI